MYYKRWHGCWTQYSGHAWNTGLRFTKLFYFSFVSKESFSVDIFSVKDHDLTLVKITPGQMTMNVMVAPSSLWGLVVSIGVFWFYLVSFSCNGHWSILILFKSPSNSSSFIPALCVGLAWPDCLAAGENRFGYRFYSEVLFCGVLTVDSCFILCPFCTIEYVSFGSFLIARSVNIKAHTHFKQNFEVLRVTFFLLHFVPSYLTNTCYSLALLHVFLVRAVLRVTP